jgi:hypothetical protein
MASEQAAQLIDETLDLVHQRLQDLQAQCLSREHTPWSRSFGSGVTPRAAIST